MPRIAEFLWDDENEAKVQAHGLTPERVDDVLTGRLAVFRNKRGMRGSYLLVGRDLPGSYVTVIIEPVLADSGLWRPVTAWLSGAGEQTKARQQGV